jgi:hypothetical protein
LAIRKVVHPFLPWLPPKASRSSCWLRAS